MAPGMKNRKTAIRRWNNEAWENGMILHIFNNQLKFSKGYFKFLKDNQFDLSNMYLIHYGKKDPFFSNEIKINNCFIHSYASIWGNLCMLKKLFEAEQIIVHSLASPALLLYLTLFPKLQKKVVWIIWGKDLYFYKLISKKRFYHRIYEWFRKKSIRNIGTIVTSIREDYEVLKSMYQVSGKYIECNVLYFYSFDNTLGNIKPCPKKKTILLGNSGSSSNNHKEAIDVLQNCTSDINKIYCPLSYGGSKKYQKQVSDYGREVLGDKFIPLTDFIPFNQYKQILQEVDIGLFNHNRQEGLANIWMLIFSGKTIYLKKGISSSRYFRRVGIDIKYIEDIKHDGLQCNPDTVLKNNQDILSRIMSAENSVKAWREILQV